MPITEISIIIKPEPEPPLPDPAVRAPETPPPPAAVQKVRPGPKKGQRGRTCRLPDCPFCWGTNCGECVNCRNPNYRNRCLTRHGGAAEFPACWVGKQTSKQLENYHLFYLFLFKFIFLLSSVLWKQIRISKVIQIRILFLNDQHVSRNLGQDNH